MSGAVPAQALSGADASTGINVDARELRNALGRFATGVCVVTTRTAAGQAAGLTVNSFSSVSLDPPLVAWCLDKRAPSLPAFTEAGHFAIHVMAADQRELAMHFARPAPGHAPDKFAALGQAVEAGLGNVPVLAHSLARFECSTASTVDCGDHFMFIGRVERYVYADHAPLLFHAGRFLEHGACA